MTIRIVQVGIGGFGSSWASEVMPSVPEVEAVGYVDMSSAALKEVVASGLATEDDCFGTLAEAIAATDPDAVLVTTNLPGHAPVVTEALEAGRHVLVEKPFASSLPEARKLVDLAAARRLTVAVSQNYRFFPAVRAVQAVVASGKLGRLLSIDVDFRKPVRMGPIRTGKPPLAEPLLSDMSIHHFDLMRAVTGQDATSVFCRTWNPDGYPYSGPPAGAGVLEFGDLAVSYRGSWISPAPETTWAGDWRMSFDKAEVTWTSRQGGLDDPAATDAVQIRWDGGRIEPVKLPKLPHLDRAGSLHEFALSLAQRRAPETAGAANLGSLAITEAMIASATSHQPVAL